MLIFNDEMYSFLQFAQRESIIAALFLQGDSSHINDEGNYVKRVEDEIDVVSFLPKSKYEKVENEWENGRIKINWNADDIGIASYNNYYNALKNKSSRYIEILDLYTACI